MFHKTKIFSIILYSFVTRSSDAACLLYICTAYRQSSVARSPMKRKIKNKDAAHLSRKIALYESFLFRYLPHLSSLSFITRLNIFDMFGSAGLDRLGGQGTPFIIFEALRKQRLHQLRHKLPLKPFTFTLLSSTESPAVAAAMLRLQAANTLSSTCKIDCREESVHDSIKQLFRQLQQQPMGERNLLLLDPLGIPQFSMADLQRLGSRKLELILFLPLAALWQLHHKPEKTAAGPELLELKKQLDSLFPPEHYYWSEELTPPGYMDCLKSGLQLQEDVFTALEPAGTEFPEAALFAMSPDGFMMEKVLQALQSLRPTAAQIPAGNQLGLFQADQPEEQDPVNTQEVRALLPEETSNQQLYKSGLHNGLLPAQLYDKLSILLKEDKIEVLDEKKKLLHALPANCISFTAFKAPKPSCYIRQKI